MKELTEYLNKELTKVTNELELAEIEDDLVVSSYWNGRREQMVLLLEWLKEKEVNEE